MIQDNVVYVFLVGVVVALLGIIGFFLAKLFDRIEKNSEILADLGSDLRLISQSLAMIEQRVTQVTNDFNTRLEHLMTEVSELRSRSHKMFGYIQALRLKAELAGWKFSNDEWNVATKKD